MFIATPVLDVPFPLSSKIHVRNIEFKNPRFLRLRDVNQIQSPIVALRVRALLQVTGLIFRV